MSFTNKKAPKALMKYENLKKKHKASRFPQAKAPSVCVPSEERNA